MNVFADLRPLRDHDTRWVIGGAVAWSVLDICLGLFGGLFLLRAGGGLLSAALWLLPLGFSLGAVFLFGRRVFARVGTRPFRLASPAGAMVVAFAFASLGARAADPPITILLSTIMALAQGLHWSAFNLVEFRRVPMADRAPYFALLSRLGHRRGDRAAQRRLVPRTIHRSHRLPDAVRAPGRGRARRVRRRVAHPDAPHRDRTQPPARYVRDGERALGPRRDRDPRPVGPRWPADHAAALAHLGHRLRGGVGVYQAANSIALFLGFTLSARSLARVGVVRSLQVGMLGMLVVNVLFVAIPDVWILFVVVPLSGVFVALWGNAAFVANQILIDRSSGDDAYTFIVAREFALGAGRTLAAALAIAAAALMGDAPARPLMAAYLLAPTAAGLCLDRALRAPARGTLRT